MNNQTWWGRYELPLNAAGRWRVGPLTIWAQRLEHEWRVGSQTAASDADSPIEIEAPTDAAPPEEEMDLRFGFVRSPEAIELVPSLADRSIVVKPQTTFYLMPGEKTTLYLTMPLWLRIECGEPPQRLLEAPITRMSDTWFGASPRAGQLCYASRARAYLRAEDAPNSPLHAICPVTIDNRAEAPAPLERLTLAAPYLALYADRDGRVWTPEIRARREHGEGLDDVRLSTAAPQQAAEAKLLANPRQKADRNLLKGVFGALLG